MNKNRKKEEAFIALARKFFRSMLDAPDEGETMTPGTMPVDSWYGRCIHDYSGQLITPKEATDWWDGVVLPDPSAPLLARPIWTRGMGSYSAIEKDHAIYMLGRQEAGYRVSFKVKKSIKAAIGDLQTMSSHGFIPEFFGIGNEPEGDFDTPELFLAWAKSNDLSGALRHAYESYGCVACAPGLINPSHAVGPWGRAMGEVLDAVGDDVPKVAKVHNYAVEFEDLIRLGFKKAVNANYGLAANNLLFLEESASGFIGAKADQAAIDRKFEEVTGPENAEWNGAGVLFGGQAKVATSPFLLWHNRRAERHTAIMHPEYGAQRREKIKASMQFMQDTGGFGTIEDLAIPHSTAKQLDRASIRLEYGGRR